MTDQRYNALLWFDKLAFKTKKTYCKLNFDNRFPSTLTGKEVEKLYCKIVINQK